MKLSPKAQKALDAVVARFQSGDLSPIVEIATIKRIGDIPADKWTFANQVLAYMQTGTVDCRGYRQWQKAGRQVQQGSRAAFILGPCTYTREDDDGKEYTVLTGFKTIPVFPHTVTEGEPLPDYTPEPEQLPPLVDVAGALDIALTWAPAAGALGVCTADGSKISLGTHDAATFFHELAHAIHARINGGLQGKRNRTAYAQQEAVAEFTATVLMHLYGLGDRTGNAWKYIQTYHKNPLAAIQRALGTVEQVLTFLEEVPCSA